MKQPSSTITAAALAGMGMTLFFELLIQFDVLQPRATLVAASVTFVTALAGYLKKETVLPMDR
jgi:hypothetical protein